MEKSVPIIKADNKGQNQPAHSRYWPLIKYRDVVLNISANKEGSATPAIELTHDKTNKMACAPNED